MAQISIHALQPRDLTGTLLDVTLPWLQELARKAFEAQQEGWDKESSTLQQQKAALARGGSQAAAVVKQIATWQASLPQAEQSLVQAPKGMLNFPVMKTRGAHAMNGIVDRGANKKRLKEDGPQADLQRTQIKNPVQVSCGDAISAEFHDIHKIFAHYHAVCLLWSKALFVPCDTHIRVAAEFDGLVCFAGAEGTA